MHRSSPELFAKVMDLLLDAVCVVDREGRFVAVSAACRRIFGYAPEEMVGRPMIDFVHPEDRTRTLQAAAEIMAGGAKPYFRNRYLRKDGETAHIMWSACWSEDEKVRIAVARDVTEQALAESLQAAIYAISEAVYAAHDLLSLFRQIHRSVAGLLPGGHLFVGLCDEEGSDVSFPVLLEENACAERMALGQSRCDAVIRVGTLLPVQDDPSALSSWIGVPLRSASGVLGALLVQSEDEAPRYSANHRDLLQYMSLQIAIAIERKQAELRIQHVALHDPLTDLPNRELFRDRLASSLGRARRQGLQVALLYIDLDGFKQVNDQHGHGVGDQLLREVAVRLQGCIREADTVGRIGGDEFMVVLDGVSSSDDALLVAEKIRAQLEQPIVVDALPLAVSSSIGVAVFPEHGGDEPGLVRCADEAMYAAKARGKNRVMLGRMLAQVTGRDAAVASDARGTGKAVG
ncbi:MAG TPA: diguanylate cyclase [Arenimonas sp.]|nr:diguanylate cyclase [Arenimonas sp.]